MRPSRKQPGCCTLCGREVFGVRARYPNDHPLAGEVRQVGAPLPTARRVTLLLMSGRTTTVTLCSSCKPTPQRLSELWTVCTQANAQELEDERRAAIGAGAFTEEQRHACTAVVQGQVVDLPIAVLALHSWEEIHDLTAPA